MMSNRKMLATQLLTLLEDMEHLEKRLESVVLLVDQVLLEHGEEEYERGYEDAMDWFHEAKDM